MYNMGSDAAVSSFDPAADPLCFEDDEPGASDDERLNLAERMLARLSFWAGSLSAMWNPAFGPFFPSDGRLAAGGATLLDMDADSQNMDG